MLNISIHPKNLPVKAVCWLSQFNRFLQVKYNKCIRFYSGTCAVIVTNNGKDRSLCANLSAAQTFTEDHLEVPENKAIIENAQFYLVTVSFQKCNTIFLSTYGLS